MGLFKQMKQAKEAISEAPGLVEDAMKMQQAAQQQAVAAQQQAAAQQQQIAAAAAANPVAAQAAAQGGTEPIAGVSLELYATISKQLVARGGDQSLAPVIAGEHGIDQASWDTAVAGWNQRMTQDPSVASQFNTLYRTMQ